MASSSTSGMASLPLKDYLKKYDANYNTEEHNTKKTKKKKKKPKTSDSVAITVVDEDPIWQKQIKEEDEDDDGSAEEEKPQINEDIEVKRLKRLEELRLRRPYHTLSDDGSGWVPITDTPKPLSYGDQSPDLSPPRRNKSNFDSPESETRNSEELNLSDLSPPRRVHGKSVEPGVADLSPPRRVRRNLEEPNVSDLSPPRRIRRNPDKSNVSNLSPPRRVHHNSDGPNTVDLSPPRRVRYNSDKLDTADLSPPRRVRHDLDEPNIADLSPPRRVRRNLDGPDIADLSQPRIVQCKSEEPNNISNLPPLSAGVPSDLSPPRKRKMSLSFSGPKKEEKRAGLFSKHEIKEQNAKRREQERARFSEMDPSISGRGAEPVFRDKEGKPLSKDELLKLKQEEEKPKEKKLEWGKGLAQKREAEAREHEVELEKNKPFARSRDDPDLDKMFREKIRWGDPMAHLVKRKHSDPILEDLGDNEKMKESGFIIPQTIPSHSWLKRGIDPPGNRYGIRPGRHWDGVDRSNGFEKEMFKRQNEKRATEQEAYLWSVSDM